MVQATSLPPNDATAVSVRSLGPTRAVRPVVGAGAALLLVTLVGCSSNRGTTETTTILFDGQPQKFQGKVICTTQPDGKLVILATGDQQATVRVLLDRKQRLIVKKVGLNVQGARGFVDDSGEVWASKVDDTYTITGRMPSDTDSTWHQFEVEVTCRNEVPLP